MGIVLVASSLVYRCFRALSVAVTPRAEPPMPRMTILWNLFFSLLATCSIFSRSMAVSISSQPWFLVAIFCLMVSRCGFSVRLSRLNW